MVTIVDLGLGNVGSIANMIKRIGCEAEITSNPINIKCATCLILPGVGAFDTGMTRVSRLGLSEVLSEVVFDRKVPILGICLGMQMMTEGSEEGNMEGLKWFSGTTRRFQNNDRIQLMKIPHMGWNKLCWIKEDLIMDGLDQQSRFYFVHSYFVDVPIENIVAKTAYGGNFASIIKKENIYGAQFHPEKSHRFGMLFLRNFISLTL